MKNRYAPYLLGLVSLSAVMAVPAFAQDKSLYYYGINAGQSNTDTDAAGTTSGLLPGVNATSTSTDQKDTAYKLFGGYQFNRNMAVEGGYFNLGHNSFDAVTAPAGTLAGNSKHPAQRHRLRVDQGRGLHRPPGHCHLQPDAV
jgi:OOP family OmpA-OmpF porin